MVRRVLSILILVMLAPACASTTTASKGPRTVTVDRADAGTTVELHPGDRLVVQLDTPTMMEWRLLLYPKDVLAKTYGSDGTGKFVFTAKTAGTGRIALMMRPFCPVPTDPRCVPEGDAVDGVGGTPPTRPLTFDVRVG